MKKYDLTEGSILSKLLLVAVPIMGTQLIQMTYNLTDMFWLGRLSSGAVAASGTAGMYMWLSMAFLLVGRMGSEIGVSQNLGRNDEKAAKEFSQNSLFVSAVLGVFCAVVSLVFSKQLIGFFNIQEKEIAESAAQYLAVVGLGSPAVFIASALVGTFNGSGNSKIPFMANGIGLVINMVLDPILIFTFNMGIMGAAIATVIAQVIVMVVFLVAIKRSSGRPFATYSLKIKPSLEKLKQILKWSLPIALESLFFTLLSMIITRSVTQFGSDAIAVQRVGSQIESLSWLIAGGFGSALTAFIGQNYGAGKWTRIHQGFKISSITMFLWGMVVTGILYFGGGLIFGLFLSEPNILAMGKEYLKILAFCQAASCLEAVGAAIFRGVGKTIPPSVASVIGNTVRVPLVFALSSTALGINGIWWGITIGGALRALAVFIWYCLYSRTLPKEDALQGDKTCSVTP